MLDKQQIVNIFDSLYDSGNNNKFFSVNIESNWNIYNNLQLYYL